MTNIDIIKMALKNLAKRKLRTALTILSVVIGATSIIIMISLGVALNENFEKNLNEMGSITNISVMPNNDKGISNEYINKFKQIEGVTAVTPYVESEFRFLLSGGKYSSTISVIGIDPSFADILGYTPIEGRTLNQDDTDTYNIVSNPLVAYYFDKKGKGQPYTKWIYDESEITPDMEKLDLLNEKISITTNSMYGVNQKYSMKNLPQEGPKKHKTFKLNVVGIVNKSEKYADNYIIMPINTLEKIKKEVEKTQNILSTKEKKGYQNVIIKCDNINIVQNVMNEIKDIGEFNIYSPIEYILSSQKNKASIQILLGAIGGISLFVAAIGITNTMFMAIYERTKEIGIMKVIGSKVSDIKKLFLLEAILIGFLGGLVGVLFSYLLSFVINKVGPFIMEDLYQMQYIDQGLPKISSIPFWLSVSSLIFASFIGLLAGYFPAKRAVNIEALKAIKSE